MAHRRGPCAVPYTPRLTRTAGTKSVPVFVAVRAVR